MPQRTVYIRKADEPLWDALKDKAELVHNALHAKQTQQPRSTDAEMEVLHPTGADNPTNGFRAGDITPLDRMVNRTPGLQPKGTANHRPLPTASNGATVNDPVPLYAIIVEMTGTVLAKNLTRDAAEAKLAEMNVDGDLKVMPQ